jgi:hypothetical protein
MRIRPAHVHARQATVLVSSTAIVNTAVVPAATTLLLGTATDGPLTLDVPLVSSSITLTSSGTPPPPPPTTTASPTPSATPSAAGATSGPSNTSVIGICVGAGLGALLLITAGVLFYRRYTRAPPSRRAGPRSPRDDDGEKGRRRSRLEPWARLDEKPPQLSVPPASPLSGLSGMNPASPGPGQLFAKSPSVLSHGGPSPEPASADVELAHKFAAGLKPLAIAPPALAVPRAQAGRAGSDADSWGGETAAEHTDSFLNLREMRMSGAMSPVLGFAKQTPPATAGILHVGALHAGESAVVVNPFTEHDGEAAETDVDEAAGPNPFFGGGGGGGDPFADAHAARARAFARSHRTVASDTSIATSASEHAMQSLIAALDLPPEDVEARLRVASMSPSELSAADVDVRARLHASMAPSAISAVTFDEEDELPEFPLPPASQGSHRS